MGEKEGFLRDEVQATSLKDKGFVTLAGHSQRREVLIPGVVILKMR